jgi:WD40 repeat protein
MTRAQVARNGSACRQASIPESSSTSSFRIRRAVKSGGELWSTDSRGTIRGQTGGDTAEDLSTVVFSPDGRLIAVGSTNGSIYLVSAASGELVRQLSPP